MIYGLELQARALTPQYGEGNDVCFFIATNSLKPTNQLHLLQYDEEQGTIQSKVSVNFALAAYTFTYIFSLS